MTSLACSDLDLSIGAVRVADGLACELRPGQFWGLLGANGAGKTTLLRCLAGLRRPDAGTILLGGSDIHALPRRDVARRLGMLQQDTVHVFDASVLETALTGRHPHLSYWQREGPDDIARARAALQAVDLDGFAGRSVTSLSGGESRRVSLAALLVQEPGIMLLDEPTNHLDLRHQLRIMALLRQRTATGRHAALAALHDVNLAARFCSHVLLLLGGGQWAAGATAELLTEARLEKLYGCAITHVADASGSWFHPRG